MKPSGLVQRTWQGNSALTLLLLPLSGLFALLVAARRWLYRAGILHSQRLPVPVVVIGNITVGGSGKTPLCLWLALRLARLGWHPGIVSRGYASALPADQTREVLADSTADEVGDEPLLLKRRSGLPVFVGRDRVAAARALLAVHPECNLLLSDDGLQHYRLARDVEIAVLDERGLMNGWPLPAGPLREPATRLMGVDALVLNGAAIPPDGAVATFRMSLAGATFFSLADPGRSCGAPELQAQRLAAIAGTGVPQRFFDQLSALGLQFSAHVFPDHHRYVAADLAGIGGDALLMTEKDAVKCAGLTRRPVWVLPVSAQLGSAASGLELAAHVENRIRERLHGRPPA